MQSIELPYLPNSEHVFEKIIDLRWPIFLDSCLPFQEQGRFDILSAHPFMTLTTIGNQTVIQSFNLTDQPSPLSSIEQFNLHLSHSNVVSTDDPFAIVKHHLNRFNTAPTKAPSTTLPFALPFTGGALGYFSYDLGRRLEQLPTIANADIAIPEMAIGFYDWAIIVDHQLKQSHLVSHHRDRNTPYLLPLLLNRFTKSSSRKNTKSTSSMNNKPHFETSNHEPLQIASSFHSNFTVSQYQSAFSKATHHIKIGDCFQINLAQRFEASVKKGSAWTSYKQLREQNPAPFAGFMKYPFLEVMCLSPERFIQNINGIVESKPIKGTRPRSKDPVIDKQLAAELLSSEKDCAENTMIVDLLRNDMGKNCEIGSITVPKLHALESFSSVHHLVSTITGKLVQGRHSVDLLRGCFPGGSVTGAPKIRAMELIDALEPHRRSLYCGSIGYIDWNGNMDMNIVIRTLLYTPLQQNLYCYAGGALVADSKVEEEYQETLIKVAKLLTLIE